MAEVLGVTPPLVTPQFVEAVLATQGYAVASEAAQMIAPTLSTQLAVAASAYAQLAFEVEPAGFAMRLVGVAAR